MQFCPNCGRKLDDDATFCSECGFDIKNNKSPTIKSSDNEILGNNGLVIGGLIAVAIFILAIGIFGLNSGDVTVGEASFNIPAGFEENMDLRKDNEPTPYGGALYARFYGDGNGNMIGLGVSSGTDYSYVDLTPFFEAQNAVKKNIGGKDGWLWRDWINQDTNGQSQYGYMFSYLDGENMVIISASEEYLIEEVIV